MDGSGTLSRRYALAEYLRLEAESPERWEYRDGKVVCLSRRMVRHSLIAANAAGEVGSRLSRSDAACYAGSLRVCVAAGWLYTPPT